MLSWLGFIRGYKKDIDTWENELYSNFYLESLGYNLPKINEKLWQAKRDNKLLGKNSIERFFHCNLMLQAKYSHELDHV